MYIITQAARSSSTVVTMTSKVNGKTEIMTPCRSEIKYGLMAILKS